LPWPWLAGAPGSDRSGPARSDRGGRRLSRPHVGFSFANGAIVVPAFGDAMDERARDTLTALLPRREIVQVTPPEPANSLGSINRITHQQPAV
jgi:agmatine deiminase